MGVMRGGPRSFRGLGNGAPVGGALRLTDEQKKKVEEIMAAVKPKIDAIREEERAKIQAAMDEAAKELRPVLTPEQQAVFDSAQKVRAAQRELNEARAALDAANRAKKPDAAPADSTATPKPQ